MNTPSSPKGVISRPTENWKLHEAIAKFTSHRDRCLEWIHPFASHVRLYSEMCRSAGKVLQILGEVDVSKNPEIWSFLESIGSALTAEFDDAPGYPGCVSLAVESSKSVDNVSEDEVLPEPKTVVSKSTLNVPVVKSMPKAPSVMPAKKTFPPLPELNFSVATEMRKILRENPKRAAKLADWKALTNTVIPFNNNETDKTFRQWLEFIAKNRGKTWPLFWKAFSQFIQTMNLVLAPDDSKPNFASSQQGICYQFYSRQGSIVKSDFFKAIGMPEVLFEWEIQGDIPSKDTPKSRDLSRVVQATSTRIIQGGTSAIPPAKPLPTKPLPTKPLPLPPRQEYSPEQMFSAHLRATLLPWLRDFNTPTKNYILWLLRRLIIEEVIPVNLQSDLLETRIVMKSEHIEIIFPTRLSRHLLDFSGYIRDLLVPEKLEDIADLPIEISGITI